MALYTALKLAHEQKALDSLATVSEFCVNHVQSNRTLHLPAGTRIPVKSLLNAVVVTGAEDAIFALATTLTPSVDDFVRQMNDAAKELKLQDSVFVYPIAHPHQVSSARDLLSVFRSIYIKYPSFAQHFQDAEFNYNDYIFLNRNSSLLKSNRIIGGMTSTYAKDLIASWSTDFRVSESLPNFLAVVLDGETEETTLNAAMHLFRNSELNFESFDLVPANTVLTHVIVPNGNRDKLNIGTHMPLRIIIPRDFLLKKKGKDFTTKILYKDRIVAPIKKGDHVATLYLSIEGRQDSYAFPLYAMHDIGIGGLLCQLINVLKLKLLGND